MSRIAGLMTVFAAVFIPSAAAASPPQVAFKLYDYNNPAIVVLDPTGTGAVVELTRGHPIPSPFGVFSWSPDGSRLVYASKGISGGDLYSVDGDGAGLTRLTSNGTNDDPAWSPVGTRIAFVHTVRRPVGLDQDIWLVGSDGSNAHALTRDGGNKYEVRWSPDGSRLLYHRTGSSASAIGTFVIDADTGAVVLRTADSGGTWSPDGSRIAVRARTGIDVVDADGRGRRTVARNAARPVWSPDGSRIAFSRSHCTRGLKGLCGSFLSSVFVVGSDGRGERRLTGPISSGPGATIEGFPNDDTAKPVWWPDGSRLFALRGSFGSRAWLLNADGTCEQQFGPASLALQDPVWHPGAIPAPSPLTCIDLRVRAVPARALFASRADPRVDVTVENDGTETATGLKVRLRLAWGQGRIRAPFGSCRGDAVVECDLPPAGPGAAQRFAVEVDRFGGSFHMEARVSAIESDSDPSTNADIAYVYVSDCDILGTRGADVLGGTNRRDKICGLGGPDRLSGGRGADLLSGDAGYDRIRPGPGRDTVSGGRGRDRIYARDRRRDTIDCGPDRDRVVADRIDEVARNCEIVRR